MWNAHRLLPLTRHAGLLARRVLPAVIGGLGAYKLIDADASNGVVTRVSHLVREFATFPATSPMSVKAESKYKCQDMVIGECKGNALFLILHLSPHASPKDCIKALQKIQAHVDRISPVDIRDDSNEVIVGLAFGPEFLAKVYPDADKSGVEPFHFKDRRGKSTQMPSTGGDILVHAVCGEKGKLFELAQAVLGDMPEKAVEKTEETYGFSYRSSRDISGFIDGIENPADEDERAEVAISEATGGSYVITQRWLHDMKKIATESQKVLESKVGRTRPDGVEIKPISPASHVGRLTYGLSDSEAQELRIVRHSLPYGTVSGECGLFFIAYAKTPKTLDWMLDRMVGLTGDKLEDGLFHFTRPLTGAYFYSPSRAELEKIFENAGGRKSASFWKH